MPDGATAPFCTAAVAAAAAAAAVVTAAAAATAAAVYCHCCLSAGDEHYAVARGVQKVLQDYKNLQVSPQGLEGYSK
jgi:hypothetical protein